MKTHDHRIALAAGALTSRLVRREALRVKAAAGRIWVTLESEPRDFVLAAGETIVVQGPGRLVIQALDDARVEVGAAPRVTSLAA